MTEEYLRLVHQAIADYHRTDSVDTPEPPTYDADSYEALVYHKAWVDTVQWHLEDIIRRPDIDPAEALTIKRRIDASNQDRTDTVESIDQVLIKQYPCYQRDWEKSTVPLATETIGWALDRLCILQLKIYHMQIEAHRPDATTEHRTKCQAKLAILNLQDRELTEAIEQLNDDLLADRRQMHLYKQMKMYNDPDTNPELYAK